MESRFAPAFLRNILAALIVFVAMCGRVFAAPPASLDLYLSFEQRLVLSLALEAATASPSRRSELLMLFVKNYSGENALSSRAVEKVQVTSFEEFLRVWRGSWPETQSLSLDLDYVLRRSPPLRREFVARSPRLQARIDEYRAQQVAQISQLLHAHGSDLMHGFFASGGSVADLEGLLRSGNDILKGLTSQFERAVGGFMDRAFASSDDPLMRFGLKTIFMRYYSQMGLDSKVRVASALLGIKLNADMTTLFGVFLQNSGPQVQKMLQAVARAGAVDAEVASLFIALERDVKPVPREQVREILARQIAYKITSFEEKPLGVGTMAQVHRAIVRIDSRETPVVIRFLKPGVAARVEEDHRILKSIALELDDSKEFREAGLPKVAPLIDEATNTVRAELDLDATIENQKLAAKVYAGRVRVVSETGIPFLLHFSAPEVYPPRGATDLHVQAMVKGRSMEKVLEEFKGVAPDLGKHVAVELARLWIREALFGSGFYHSDLHQGNLLADVRDTDVRLSILDYGMAGRVSRQVQENLLAMSSAVAIAKGPVIAKTFYELSTPGEKSPSLAELEREVDEELAQRRREKMAPRTMIEWTAFMIDRGLVLSYDVVALNRGAAGLELMLKSVGSEKTFFSIAMDLGMRHPIRISTTLMRYGFGAQDLIRLGMMPKDGVSQFAPPTMKAPPVDEGSAFQCRQIFLPAK